MDYLILCGVFTTLLTLGQCDMTVVQVESLGQNVQLNCSNSSISASMVTPIHWVISDATILKPGDLNSNPHVSPDGKTLEIMDIHRAHLGLYACYANLSGNMNETYFRINVHLKRQSLWEIYRMNVIIGVSAAAVGLVLAVLMCLVYHYRWRPDEDYANDVSAYNGRKMDVVSYGNQAYNTQDEGESYPYVDVHHDISATKM